MLSVLSAHGLGLCETFTLLPAIIQGEFYGVISYGKTKPKPTYPTSSAVVFGTVLSFCTFIINNKNIHCCISSWVWCTSDKKWTITENAIIMKKVFAHTVSFYRVNETLIQLS